MERLSAATLRQLPTLLRDARQVPLMTRLYNEEPAAAIRAGVLAGLLECEPSDDEINCIKWTAPLRMDPGTMPTPEVTVHCLHAMGDLGYCSLAAFACAFRAYPRAVHFVARHSPWVRNEIKWLRRKLLLCCMARRRAKGLTHGVLHALAAHECLWYPILAFL